MEKDPLKCGIFAHDLPPSHRPTDLFPWLLAIALCLLPFDIAVRRLALDPEPALLWMWMRVLPAFALVSAKARQMQQAAKEALAGSRTVVPPPPDIVPTGDQRRAAQSKYEEAGGSTAAQDMNLNPTAQDESKPVVGGTKVSPTDEAASDYTRALLKAKKRAKKDGQ